MLKSHQRNIFEKQKKYITIVMDVLSTFGQSNKYSIGSSRRNKPLHFCTSLDFLGGWKGGCVVRHQLLLSLCSQFSWAELELINYLYLSNLGPCFGYLSGWMGYNVVRGNNGGIVDRLARIEFKKELIEVLCKKKH